MHAARAGSDGLDKENNVAESKERQNGLKNVLNKKKCISCTQQLYITEPSKWKFNK
jgi:hypothetical protein